MVDNAVHLTLRHALQKGEQILKSGITEAPRRDAGVLMCHAIKKDLVFLHAHGDCLLTPIQEKFFFELVKRRADGEPLQYITCFSEFMSLSFIVNKDVLIPRQDTETLVEAVMEHVSGHYTLEDSHTKDKRVLEILDIGTGSGCIAISLAKYLEAVHITAVDISHPALAVAMENAKKNQVEHKITWMQSDLFSAFEGCEKQEIRFDVIVSNPPYIDYMEMDALSPEVKCFEPGIALFANEEGLSYYHRISRSAQTYLKNDGILAFEIGYRQAKAVIEILNGSYEKIQVTKDLSGNDRVVMAQKKRIANLIKPI